MTLWLSFSLWETKIFIFFPHVYLLFLNREQQLDMCDCEDHDNGNCGGGSYAGDNVDVFWGFFKAVKQIKSVKQMFQA